MKTKEKIKDNLPLTERCMYNQLYHFLLDDRDRTFNINMHTFETFAISEAEAIGKMFLNRPEFKNREIISISVI